MAHMDKHVKIGSERSETEADALLRHRKGAGIGMAAAGGAVAAVGAYGLQTLIDQSATPVQQISLLTGDSAVGGGCTFSSVTIVGDPYTILSFSCLNGVHGQLDVSMNSLNQTFTFNAGNMILAITPFGYSTSGDMSFQYQTIVQHVHTFLPPTVAAALLVGGVLLAAAGGAVIGLSYRAKNRLLRRKAPEQAKDETSGSKE